MVSKYRFASGLAMAMAMVGTALAQDAPTPQATQKGDESSGVADIIVTATRREQTLHATPLAVTAVTSEGLTARGINGLGDCPIAHPSISG